MGRLREVALLLSFCILLGSTAAYYEYEDFDEDGDGDADYSILDEDYFGEEEIEEEDATPESVETPEGIPPTDGPLNRQYFPECNNEECWIRVDWEPPERGNWMSCMLGYKVGSSESDWDTQDFDHDGVPNSIDEDDDNDGVPDDEDCDSDMDGICDDTAENGKYYDWNWIYDRSTGTHADVRSDQIFFLEEAEGTNHSLTIRNLKFDSSYWIDIVVETPHGPQSSWDRHVDRVATPPEPCRDASVPHPDKFVESSDNSLSVQLDGWEETNCPTLSFVVEQRQRGEEDWSLVTRSANPGTNLIVSNLSPATWYQIKVTGKTLGNSPDQETRETSLEFEIATLAADGSGFSGCVIEKDVKYSGNTLSSQRGINQETCALLCFKKPACTHWTYNPTFQGGKCWMKSSDSGRAKSTTGSSSGQKACGGKGFSIPEVNKAAAAAMADCSHPWTSVETGCYLFQKSNSTWYEARRDCQQKGGHLVEIDSKEEEEAIIDGISRQGWDGDLGFWIGLTDIFHDGTWVWDHFGRPLNFSNWAPGEPNNLNGLQHCAALDLYVGGWTDVGCDSVRAEQYGSICEAAGSSMTYTKQTGKKWENGFGKTSHMKVLMVHDEDDCGKECTATAPCVAFTFIPGMEICALKAPKDAVTLVPAGGDMISGRLDGERPGVQLKALDSTICLPCLPVCNLEEGTKYSGHNLFPLGAETQEECAAACLREPECHFWTHNPNVGKCWLKKSDLGRAPSSKGSNSGQKSCGVTEDDLLSGHIIDDGCDCTSETTEACSLEENTKYSGHNLYTTKGIKVGNMAGCASLCFEDNKCKFWTYNPRVSKCWMKTSDRGRGPSTKGSVSGQKACGAPGALSEEPEQPEQTSGHLSSPNFPANYPNDIHERKTIEVAKGNVIKIHFTDFDLERPDQVDYVDLTDGDGSFLGRFGARHYVDEEGNSEGSGVEGPKFLNFRISDITSNTETVHVLFHTDGSVTRSGWRLEWSSSPSPPMEERELATSGVLTSLNFPERYLGNLDIVKKIQVPEGNTIRIRFTDFDCEPKYDTVTITDKDGTRLGLFDGGENSYDDWQKEIVSNTDTVEVLFHTDETGMRTGWRLDWGIVGAEESMPKSGVLMSPNYPQRYPSNHDSTQIVEVAEGKYIRFEFTNFNTEPEYDWVQVVDPSGTHLTPVEDGGKIWGSSLPPHSPGIRSKSNIIHVNFHTDGPGQRSGWRMEWTETEDAF